jgi:hypothetical protein
VRFPFLSASATSSASESNSPVDTAKVLGFFFAVSAGAGLVSALRKKLGWRDTLVAIGASGIGGLTVGAVCTYLWGPDRWYLTCAVTSVVGWSGGTFVLDQLGAYLEARVVRLIREDEAARDGLAPRKEPNGETSDELPGVAGLRDHVDRGAVPAAGMPSVEEGRDRGQG